jgi:integrase/recombinase XerD
VKNLNLENASFRYIEQSFREWLDILGYSEVTVYNLPNMVRELLHYMEEQRLNNIKDLTVQTIEAYYQKLKERSNQRKNGALSNGHLNKHIQALRKFTEYLRTVGRVQIGIPRLENEEASHKTTWLTTEEIQDLFKASHKEAAAGGKHIYNFIEKQEAFRSRDRAMLAIFYGCGLRRNEGVHLDIGDINFDRSMLHVRKGKNNKERLVPISKTSLKHLQD